MVEPANKDDLKKSPEELRKQLETLQRQLSTEESLKKADAASHNDAIKTIKDEITDVLQLLDTRAKN
jgi:ribosomal protein L29